MTGFWGFGKCPDNLLSSVFIQSHGGTLCAGLGTEHIACVLPHDLLLGYRAGSDRRNLAIPFGQRWLSRSRPVVQRHSVRSEVAVCSHTFSDVQHCRLCKLQPCGAAVFDHAVHLHKRMDQPVDDREQEYSVVTATPEKSRNETGRDEASNTLRTVLSVNLKCACACACACTECMSMLRACGVYVRTTSAAPVVSWIQFKPSTERLESNKPPYASPYSSIISSICSSSKLSPKYRLSAPSKNR